jgi:magnesium transporter
MRLNAMTGGLVEVVRAVFEASNLLEQQRQGATTRQLAAWAAILAVPAAAAGVYSIQGSYGFPFVAAGMAAACLALYFRFKRLRWL